MKPYVTFTNQRFDFPFANLFNGNRKLAERLNGRALKGNALNEAGDTFKLQASAPWYRGRLYISPAPAAKGKLPTADNKTYTRVVNLLRRLRNAFPFQSPGRVKLWQITETHPWGQYIA